MKLIRLTDKLDLYYWSEGDRIAWRLCNSESGRIIAYESPSECFTVEQALKKAEVFV